MIYYTVKGVAMLKGIIDLLNTYQPNTKGVSREASVMIPLIHSDDQWHILFEKRAFHLKAQPGEVCFPGGMMEPHETSLEACIRETSEELCLDLDSIEVVGQLDSLNTAFDMIIHCHVGILHTELSSIQPNAEEVDSIFTVPISFLTETTPQKHMIRNQLIAPFDFPLKDLPNGEDYQLREKNMPVLFYHYENQIIWGLTAKMLDQFQSLLLEKEKPK